MAVDGDAWQSVSLGEGMTPLVELEPGLYVKVDYAMPTLSFKDRGAATLVAHMKAIGVKSCVQDSSGNAGNAVAAYCARAGIQCEIYVPEGTSPKKITMIEAHGAKVHVIPGSRDHCADVCRAKIARAGLYIEHTTAANFAAWDHYCELYGPSTDVLITLCGAGIKSDH